MIFAQIIVIFLTRVCFAPPPDCIPTSKDEIPTGDKDFSKLIVKETANVCRTASICGFNNSVPTNARCKSIYRSRKTCCKDCACDESCGIRGDCCFPTAEDKNLENIRRQYQECILPTTKDIFPSASNKYKFYYMTTVCPTGKGVPYFNGREDCGNIAVALWGSLYPLYSPSTGRLYKNRACADCHGIHDGLISMAFMDCGMGHSFSVADHFNGLDRNSLSSDCDLRFAFQQALKTERCYLELIDTCNDTKEIVTPYWSEMTSEQIVNACHNGIAAPYQESKAYSNVFCYLCNGGRFSSMCTDLSGDSFSGIGSAYPYLLEGDILERAVALDADAERRPVACLSPDIQNTRGDCVPVNCPTAQMHNKKFHCVHLSSKWYISYYHITLRLKLVSVTLNVTTLMAVIHDNADINFWILSPWPLSWDISSLYYETGSDENTTSHVESFLVTLITPPNKKIKAVLWQIDRYSKRDWTLKVRAKSFMLSADLFKSEIIEDRFGAFAPKWYSGFSGLDIPQTYGIDRYRKYSIQLILKEKIDLSKELLPIGRITKMYFCKQVPLGANSSHYELLANKRLLYYNGKVYYDGEFELVSREDGSLEPRICLLDSPYTEMPVERSGSAPVTAVMVTFVPFVLLFVHFKSVVEPMP